MKNPRISIYLLHNNFCSSIFLSIIFLSVILIKISWLFDIFFLVLIAIVLFILSLLISFLGKKCFWRKVVSPISKLEPKLDNFGKSLYIFKPLLFSFGIEIDNS